MGRAVDVLRAYLVPVAETSEVHIVDRPPGLAVDAVDAQVPVRQRAPYLHHEELVRDRVDSHGLPGPRMRLMVQRRAAENAAPGAGQVYEIRMSHEESPSLAARRGPHGESLCDRGPAPVTRVAPGGASSRAASSGRHSRGPKRS